MSYQKRPFLLLLICYYLVLPNFLSHLVMASSSSLQDEYSHLPKLRRRVLQSQQRRRKRTRKRRNPTMFNSGSLAGGLSNIMNGNVKKSSSPQQINSSIRGQVDPAKLVSRNSQEYVGINNILKKMQFRFKGLEQEFKIYRSKINLGSMNCNQIQVTDLDQSFQVDRSNNREAFMDLLVSGLKMTCSGNYNFDSGFFFRRSGRVNIDIGSSLDLQLKISTPDSFSTSFPNQAKISKCQSQAGFRLDFLGGGIGNLIESFVDLIDGRFEDEMKKLLCNSLEEELAVLFSSLLGTIQENLEPYTTGEYDITNVDPLLFQGSIDQSAGYVNYNEIDFYFNDFEEFVGSEWNFLKDMKGLLQEVFMSGSTTSRRELIRRLDDGSGNCLDSIVDTIIDLITGGAGDGSSFIDMIIDLISGLFSGGGGNSTLAQSAFALNSFKLANVDVKSAFCDGDWTFNILDLDLVPDDLTHTISLEGGSKITSKLSEAMLTSGGIESFLLQPIGNQTLEATIGLPSTSLTLGFILSFQGGTLVNNDDFVIQFPATSIEPKLILEMDDVTSKIAGLAAIKVDMDKELTTENVIQWMCEIFPLLRLSYLDITADYKPARAINFFPPGNGVDNFLLEIITSLMEIYDHFFENAARNVAGYWGRGLLDTFLQTAMETSNTAFETNSCGTTAERRL